MSASENKAEVGTHHDEEERAGQALRDAQVISAEELEKAVSEHERTGKPLKTILFGPVLVDRIRRVLQTEITLGTPAAGQKKSLADVLIDAGWITRDQHEEAKRQAEESGHPLGRILLDQGLITMEQLDAGLKLQGETGHTLGRTLMNLGYVLPKDVSDALWAQRTVPFLSLKRDDEEIGKMLVARNLLGEDRWKTAWEDYLASKKRFVDYMLEKDLATEEQLAQVMADYHKLPYLDLRKTTMQAEAIAQLPAALIHETQSISFAMTDTEIHVASYEPKRVSSFDTIGAMTGRRVKRFLAPRSQVLEAIGRYVEALPSTEGGAREGAPAIEQVRRDEMTAAFTQEGEKLLAQLATSSTTELVQKIIEGAVNARATDIHFDPQENVLRVRYRVDGMLHDVMNLPITQAPHVISRIKVMANMDIVDRLHPQDGHINTLVQGRYRDMRIASIPSSLGEKLTIRVMDPTNVLTGLTQLGFEDHQLEVMHKLIRKPYGLILATGPVGSGKTTTLYACLNHVNVLEKNVMTIEDPVEYRLRGTNQVQVDYKRNLGFAEGLRSMLRQDPNVIMVGEIRDNDTARTAVRASLTGVMVLSTMHANDAPGTVSTLFNHGIPGFLVANSLVGVVAQRLVRRICPDCVEEYKPDREMLRQMRIRGIEEGEFTFARGKGCARCFHTGYLGRTGVYEVMEVDEEIKDLIFRQTTREVIRQVAMDMGMQTLAKSAFNKVAQRVTTVEEFFRVVFM
ncbi:MAG: ATPase, T2SS/T4P/T4SS family [Planctomycetota bacterium]